jgi:hypothetical protein
MRNCKNKIISETIIGESYCVFSFFYKFSSLFNHEGHEKKRQARKPRNVLCLSCKNFVPFVVKDQGSF